MFPNSHLGNKISPSLEPMVCGIMMKLAPIYFSVQPDIYHCLQCQFPIFLSASYSFPQIIGNQLLEFCIFITLILSIVILDFSLHSCSVSNMLSSCVCSCNLYWTTLNVLSVTCYLPLILFSWNTCNNFPQCHWPINKILLSAQKNYIVLLPKGSRGFYFLLATQLPILFPNRKLGVDSAVSLVAQQ